MTKKFLGIILFITFCSCSNDVSVSVAPKLDSFNELPKTTNPKIDILWVVDPSRSMFSEIQAVQNNIDQFVSAFLDKKLDFRMGVITTSAWSSLAEGQPGNEFLTNNPFKSLNKGGCIGNVQTEDFVTDTSAPSPQAFKNLFKVYIDVYGLALNTVACGLEGPPFAAPPNDFPSIDIVNGYSANNIFSNAEGRTKVERGQYLPYVNDERPLQSMQAFMNPSALTGGSNDFSNLSSSTGASNFLRDDAFLAVIVVTDEKDSSRNSLVPNSSADSDHTSNQYLSYLDELKNGRSNYTVFSIIDTSLSNNILSSVAVESGSTPIDINTNFASELANISTNIISDASFFPISCKAIPETIKVVYEFEGQSFIVPDAPVGFTYNPTQQGLKFSPEHVPPGGSSVQVVFQPVNLSCTPGTGGATVRPLTLTSNEVSESASLGATVGTVEITERNENLTYTFSIDPVSAEFVINPQTGVITTDSTFDYETLNTYRIDVVANNGSSNITENFVIAITDVSDTSALAVEDNFSVSESQISGGNSVNLNLKNNDTGLDLVDTHTYTTTNTTDCSGVGFVSGDASASDVSLQVVSSSAGSFSFRITSAINLSAGASASVVFRYGVIDSGTGSCSTALVNIDITGENQVPAIALDGASQPNPFPMIDSSGTVGPVLTTVLNTSNVKDSASATTLADGAPLTTSVLADGYHAVDVELSPVGSSTVFEVSQFQIAGPSGYDFGNTVMQIIFDDGATERVLTREVLPVDQGNSVNIDFTNIVFGNKARFIRPSQAVNSNNDDDISLSSIAMTARAVDISCVNIMEHVSDADIPDSPAPLGTDRLEFFVADALAEGAAPAWAFISNSGTVSDFRDDRLCVRPPNGTNISLSLVARDLSGAILTQVFNVVRDDGGTPTINSTPVALFQALDENRGGITYKRYGGRNGRNQSSPFMDYVYAEPGATTCSVGPGSSDVDHTELDEFIISPIFPDLPLVPDIDTAQTSSAGEFYDGWSTECLTVYEEKFTQSNLCTYPSGTPTGVLSPCIISGTNVYGETYTGYFAPTETGIYRFRSSSVDNAVRLLMAPSEYESDLLPVVTGSLDNSTVRQMGRTTDTGVDPSGSWGCSGGQLNSMVGGSGSAFRFYDYSIYGDNPTCGSEFFPNEFGGGHSTNVFYSEIDNPASAAFQPEYNATTDYKDGWVFLKQGSLYATQIRFAEGGSGKRFLFSFDYKPLGVASFSGDWRNLDAVSLIPTEGSEAYGSLVIPITAGEVSFFASDLFYDVEFDVLEYGARLVNSDGTASSSGLADIGLVLNSTTGQLSGSVNNPSNLRVVFSATDPDGSTNTVEYLPLKIE